MTRHSILVISYLLSILVVKKLALAAARSPHLRLYCTVCSDVALQLSGTTAYRRAELSTAQEGRAAGVHTAAYVRRGTGIP